MSDRREHVPFDAHFFEKKAAEGQTYSSKAAFRHIYTTNHWAGAESVSGEGAARRQTRHLEAALPALLAALEGECATCLDGYI